MFLGMLFMRMKVASGRNHEAWPRAIARRQTKDEASFLFFEPAPRATKPKRTMGVSLSHQQPVNQGGGCRMLGLRLNTLEAHNATRLPPPPPPHLSSSRRFSRRWKTALSPSPSKELRPAQRYSAQPTTHGCLPCYTARSTASSSSSPSTTVIQRRGLVHKRICIFFATHEPCSLCPRGIAWSGFSEFYYLFTYVDSRDLFSIPYDIDILESVFRVQGEETEQQVNKRALYNKTNKFFRGRSVGDLLDDLWYVAERKTWRQEIQRVEDLYSSLSETYQKGKKSGAESSSVWK
ncbi:cytidine/deoxycytidylate deaminase family protein [Metarhizium acridum CQMa 102]|uniref:Cytidine/deoxycytidylate deaminase family protein n=1 Tax=Metarhizium acridum (strain CQMa 102) TaxID=655827 RepID=E9E4K5_METAQ|nr:cytidine/deoxycytidylate deaminase family protein [Metarhizium acridum CQMa 102]EFY89216.1 cytidine/deoxycytidylate deaminase family protein [Metarhizium acridum CQMa 102]